MGVRGYLLRGVVAGMVAGLLAGLFGFFVAEPVIDHAVDLESQRITTEYHQALDQALIKTNGDVAAAEKMVIAPAPAVFSRDTQHEGLIVGTTLYGIGVGGIFALVFLVVSKRSVPRSLWQRSLGLAGAVVTGLYLLPFLRYPANPPGIGNPDTIGQRTYFYGLAVALGVLAVWGSWRVALLLRGRGVDEPLRHLAVAGIIAAALMVMFLALPDSGDAVKVPADVVWDFRVRSLATQALLWSGLAAGFALLVEHALGHRIAWRMPRVQLRRRLET